MKITEKILNKTRHQKTVDFSTDDLKKFFDQALQKLSKDLKISGFRPGKAPRNMAKDNIKEESLREEAYSLSVRDAWLVIVKELKVTPIQDPEVNVLTFEEGKEGKIVFEYDVRPEVKIGKWEKIKTTDVKPTTIKDEEIEQVLKNLSKGHAKKVMTLEKAMKGNQLDIEFTGTIGGIRKDKLTSKHFPVILGESQLVPGFEKYLFGLKKGDETKFKITFPQDYFDKEMVGKEVEFSVKVEEVYTVDQPELDSKFAQKFGHKKLDEMRKAIREDLENRNVEEFDNRKKAKWLAEFEKLINTDIPKSLLDGEMTRSESHWREFLKKNNLEESDWLARQKTTLEQLRKDWEKAATISVRIGLGLSQAAHDQGRDLKDNNDFQDFLDELIAKTK